MSLYAVTLLRGSIESKVMRDPDVRIAVREDLNLLHADDEDTRIIEEMGIWAASVRIDVAVVNGELCGFELKSAKDDLRRLPTQEQIYSQVFDRVTIITAENHFADCQAQVPDWWGLTLAKMSNLDRVTLTPVREARLNPAHNPLFVARMLWKDEAIDVLAKSGLADGFRSKPIALIHERLAEAIPLEKLRAEVRRVLKSRN